MAWKRQTSEERRAERKTIRGMFYPALVALSNKGRKVPAKYAGKTVRDRSENVYRIEPSGALVRIFPEKVKGKSTKRAAKRRRMARLNRGASA